MGGGLKEFFGRRPAEEFVPVAALVEGVSELSTKINGVHSGIIDTDLIEKRRNIQGTKALDFLASTAVLYESEGEQSPYERPQFQISRMLSQITDILLDERIVDYEVDIARLILNFEIEYPQIAFWEFLEETGFWDALDMVVGMEAESKRGFVSKLIIFITNGRIKLTLNDKAKYLLSNKFE